MKLSVNTKLSTYDIIIQKGILNNLKDYLDIQGKVMIISDNGVPSIYLDTVKKQFNNAYTFVIKQGEKSKNFENYLKIQEKLLENNFSRYDYLIALGGGVVGDLTGFVASTFKRGIRYIQIPTTTLSQIDSSIGGKTAIDFNGYKNVIGTFYQPSLVLIDINVLSTLSNRHFNNGLVEALKIGLTFDEELVSLFERGNIQDNLEEIITKALVLKKRVVEQDEKENGLRKVLNFGHTIGHAIESSYLGELFHGECVAKGMLYFINDNHLKARVKNILNKLNIETSYDLDLEKIQQFIYNDKKADGSNVSTIIVDKVGTYEINELPIKDILKKIREE